MANQTLTSLVNSVPPYMPLFWTLIKKKKLSQGPTISQLCSYLIYHFLSLFSGLVIISDNLHNAIVLLRQSLTSIVKTW